MATPTTSGTVSYVSATSINEMDSMGVGTKWGGAAGSPSTISYSFPNSGSYFSTDPATGYGPSYRSGEPWSMSYFTATQAAIASAALAKWANVASISFQQTSDNPSVVGDLRFGWSSNNFASGRQAHAYYAFPDVPKGGDIWLNSNMPASTWGNFSVGSYGFFTLIHEIGHAIGLKHPFEAETWNPATLPSSQNVWHNTVMSYSAYPGATGVEWTFMPTTPMSLDIQAVQYLYGVNSTYRGGNDVYSYSQGQSYFETIWDAGGTDTITYTGVDFAELDLRPGAWSNVGGILTSTDGRTSDYTVNIYKTVVIENAIGGNGSDLIYGNDVANLLQCNSGDDEVYGYAGQDTIFGGLGNDTVDGGSGADAMFGGAGNDTFIVDDYSDGVTELANEGTDTVKASVSHALGPNIENLILAGSSSLNGTGNALNNFLTGNAAANRLDGGAGADTMIGGLGDDVYVVDNAGDSVVESGANDVDSVESFVSYSLGANLENLGLLGNSAINGAGNSLGNVIAGNGANNVLDGGTGTDTVSYEAAVSAATVSLLLAGTPQATGGAGIDTLIAIENLFGSPFGDTLTGDSASNVLRGGGGRDTLIGGAGSDTVYGDAGRDSLIAGAGSDWLFGGGGLDTAVFSRARSDYVMARVSGSMQLTSVDGTSTMSNVEMLRFGDGTTYRVKSMAQACGADFNGDGFGDILWRNDGTGQSAVWLMRGTSLVGGGALPDVPSPWDIRGAGDFNGDGRDDILWRNDATGQSSIWSMNGTSLVGGGALLNVPDSWDVVGTGDLNGDGRDDIIWRNDNTGQNAAWLMNGTSVTGGGAILDVPTAWEIAGSGDFNGDRRDDILWRNESTGQSSVWLMNGTTVVGGAALPNVPSPWGISGIADFNGDLRDDIFWRNEDSGQASMWFMNGVALSGGGATPSVPMDWQVGGFGDFTGDGHDDILWRNAATGQSSMWPMDGLSVVGGGALPFVPNEWLFA